MPIIKLMAVAMLVATTAGSVGSETHYIRAEATWAQLSSDQREMIDLVAADIWSTEREGGKRVLYRDLNERLKTDLRLQAMDRLGFEHRPVRGVEV
ncbi:hypothetical protein HK107_10790 [Parvularcula sp. ZS-1/3]|uniref:Uncharacterized protein n=1 Tax=Parvularcula mediterranea TaxID=2732508 RepID=A0A7Y3RML6_9PROT|nr:hypothetical protein [Parvularcula mediterranea]NNU16804.1 hypothetical protein [Parvularcula mediterranea]